MPAVQTFGDLNSILAFVAVAREGGLTRGAASLELPKSTVSRQLAALEREAGARLVEMTSRRFALTELGRLYFERLEHVVDELQDAHKVLTAQESRPRGRLRVSAPTDFAMFALADVLKTFVERCPDVQVELVLTPHRVDLRAERFDVAIRMGRLDDSSLVARRIANLARGLYAAPALLAGKRGVPSLEDIAGLPFVSMALRSDGPTVTLTSGRRKTTLETRGRLVVNSIGMLRQLAIAGAGVAVLPDSMAVDDLATGRLVRIAPEWQLEPIPASLVITDRKHLPAKTRAFIAHLLEAFGEQRPA